MGDRVEFKVGDKVHYTASHGEKQNGIVKGFSPTSGNPFVVYHCDGDWDGYQNYTGSNTHPDNLKLGWI